MRLEIYTNRKIFTLDTDRVRHCPTVTKFQKDGINILVVSNNELKYYYPEKYFKNAKS